MEFYGGDRPIWYCTVDRWVSRCRMLARE